jgi:hypothetical protein
LTKAGMRLRLLDDVEGVEAENGGGDRPVGDLAVMRPPRGGM